MLVALEGLGLIVLAGLVFASGLAHDAAVPQLVAQAAYFVILGAALGLVASGLLRGRRWGRSPALVAQVVVVAIGMWMAFPSDRLPQGIALMGLGVLILGLLVTSRANHWIRQFPQPLGGNQP